MKYALALSFTISALASLGCESPAGGEPQPAEGGSDAGEPTREADGGSAGGDTLDDDRGADVTGAIAAYNSKIEAVCARANACYRDANPEGVYDHCEVPGAMEEELSAVFTFEAWPELCIAELTQVAHDFVAVVKCETSALDKVLTVLAGSCPDMVPEAFEDLACWVDAEQAYDRVADVYDQCEDFDASEEGQ